jgi:hypothetical protein
VLVDASVEPLATTVTGEWLPNVHGSKSYYSIEKCPMGVHSMVTTVFNGAIWVTKRSYLPAVTLPDITTMRFSSQGSRLILGSSSGQLQLLNAQDFKAVTEAINVGGFPVVGLEFSRDNQWLYVVFNTGKVNLHSLANASLPYIATVTEEFSGSDFQRVRVLANENLNAQESGN